MTHSAAPPRTTHTWPRPDTSSFPAYLRSLHLAMPVTTRPGRLVAGPPRFVFDWALRLGLGPLVLDTPRNRAIAGSLGVQPDDLAVFARRLRARAKWREVWGEMALTRVEAAETALGRGDRDVARRALQSALHLLGLAYGGDGYYFHTPLRERARALSITVPLHETLRNLSGDRVERLEVTHPHGATTGILRFPPVATLPGGSRRIPALLALHPLAGHKDSFDLALAPFREAGYATLCVDLPAHGANFGGPRLRPDDEVMGVAALEALAAHPAIDPDRLGILGGSLGAFYALRTAAASSLARVCLAYASPFDIAAGIRDSVPGLKELFRDIIGAPTLEALYRLAEPFHLRGAAEAIRCPVCLVHGTQDHICDFAASYEIARRVSAPVTVFPLTGADHEAAVPSAPHVAGPGVAWLQQALG